MFTDYKPDIQQERLDPFVGGHATVLSNGIHVRGPVRRIKVGKHHLMVELEWAATRSSRAKVRWVRSRRKYWDFLLVGSTVTHEGSCLVWSNVNGQSVTLYPKSDPTNIPRPKRR